MLYHHQSTIRYFFDMSSLQLLNRLAKSRSGYASFESLEEDFAYKVKNFEKHDNNQNNWGSRVRVNLDDGRYVILPSRFNNLLKNDQLRKMNKEKLSIVYKGKEGSYTIIEFKNQSAGDPEKKKRRTNTNICLKDIFDDKYEVDDDNDGNGTDCEENSTE